MVTRAPNRKVDGILKFSPGEGIRLEFPDDFILGRIEKVITNRLPNCRLGSSRLAFVIKIQSCCEEGDLRLGRRLYETTHSGGRETQVRRKRRVFVQYLTEGAFC